MRQATTSQKAITPICIRFVFARGKNRCDTHRAGKDAKFSYIVHFDARGTNATAYRCAVLVSCADRNRRYLSLFFLSFPCFVPLEIRARSRRDEEGNPRILFPYAFVESSYTYIRICIRIHIRAYVYVETRAR